MLCMEVQVRAGDAAGEAEALGLGGQRLDVARERIVGLVAMQVDQEAALCRDLAEVADRGGTFRHRALEMRDAADHLDAQVERLEQEVARARIAVEAVLRESDELQGRGRVLPSA